MPSYANVGEVGWSRGGKWGASHRAAHSQKMLLRHCSAAATQTHTNVSHYTHTHTWDLLAIFIIIQFQKHFCHLGFVLLCMNNGLLICNEPRWQFTLYNNVNGISMLIFFLYNLYNITTNNISPLLLLVAYFMFLCSGICPDPIQNNKPHKDGSFNLPHNTKLVRQKTQCYVFKTL